MVAESRDIRQLKAAQAVLLPGLTGTTLEQTASLLGVGRASVHRLQQQFRHSLQTPSRPRKKWGGRRRALLSWEEEEAFGIVTRSAGLLNPNHYLAVAISYLFRHREGWRSDAGVGKTLVSSSMIDRVTAGLGRGRV